MCPTVPYAHCTYIHIKIYLLSFRFLFVQQSFGPVLFRYVHDQCILPAGGRPLLGFLTKGKTNFLRHIAARIDQIELISVHSQRIPCTSSRLSSGRQSPIRDPSPRWGAVEFYQTFSTTETLCHPSALCYESGPTVVAHTSGSSCS